MSSCPEDPSIVKHFRGHKGGITSLSFNPYTEQLVSGSVDSYLMLWNFAAGVRAYR